MGYLVPHLRNHHIILAKKVENIEEAERKRNTTDSIQEWLEIRSKTLGY